MQSQLFYFLLEGDNLPTLDLAGLCKWGVDKAIGHAESKTQLPLGDLVSPLANGLITSLGIQALEIDPLVFLMGRIVVAGIDQQKKRSEARRMNE